MKSIFITLFFLSSSSLSYAEVFLSSSNASNIEELVNHADVIVEGQVSEIECFIDKDSVIYTSAKIKISKIFKGADIDSTIELVYLGGHYDGITIAYQNISSHSLSLIKGRDGIFFLKSNKTDPSLRIGMKCYSVINMRGCFIHYHHNDGNPLATSHFISSDDIGKDVYNPIQKTTHIPPKILGLNTFEIEEAKKKR